MKSTPEKSGDEAQEKSKKTKTTTRAASDRIGIIKPV